MAVFVCFGLLVDHPAWAKPWLLVLLIIVLLAWILNVALTAVLRCGWGVGAWTWCSTQPARSAARLATSLPTAPLLASSLCLHCLPRAGNDVCVNLEPKATELLGDSVSLGGAGVHPMQEAAGACHAVRTPHAFPGSCCIVQVCLWPDQVSGRCFNFSASRPSGRRGVHHHAPGLLPQRQWRHRAGCDQGGAGSLLWRLRVSRTSAGKSTCGQPLGRHCQACLW